MPQLLDPKDGARADRGLERARRDAAPFPSAASAVREAAPAVSRAQDNRRTRPRPSSRCPRAQARARARSSERGAAAQAARHAAAGGDGRRTGRRDILRRRARAAVKAFQTEKGLEARRHRRPRRRAAALNDVDMPSPARLLANMEEWRWMPDDLGSYYVWVNVPEFMIRVVKDGQMIHEERVVTGHARQADAGLLGRDGARDLPSALERARQSIKVRELYPSLARGGSYFERQGLRITKNGRPVDPYTVDWSRADIRKLRRLSAVGRRATCSAVVKFSFPNKHTVYMHDTPTKGLFDEASRAFSHGCMRVRNPVKLAAGRARPGQGLGRGDRCEIDCRRRCRREPHHARPQGPGPHHLLHGVDRRPGQRAIGARTSTGTSSASRSRSQGRFDEIARGPDHLAPVSRATRCASSSRRTRTGSFFNSLFGGF